MKFAIILVLGFYYHGIPQTTELMYPVQYNSMEECMEYKTNPSEKHQKWLMEHVKRYAEAGYQPSIALSHVECRKI